MAEGSCLLQAWNGTENATARTGSLEAEDIKETIQNVVAGDRTDGDEAGRLALWLPGLCMWKRCLPGSEG